MTPGSSSSRPSKNRATSARLNKVNRPGMAAFTLRAAAALVSGWMSLAGIETAR
jgi:hypothetical protein